VKFKLCSLNNHMKIESWRMRIRDLKILRVMLRIEDSVSVCALNRWFWKWNEPVMKKNATREEKKNQNNVNLLTSSMVLIIKHTFHSMRWRSCIILFFWINSTSYFIFWIKYVFHHYRITFLFHLEIASLVPTYSILLNSTDKLTYIF